MSPPNPFEERLWAGMTVELSRASSPRCTPAEGCRSFPCPFPRGGVRNAWRFTAPAAPGLPARNRHTRRPVLTAQGSRCSKEQTAGPPFLFASERQPAPEAGTSPAFRTRMDFAACCMSQEAPFCRRVPVRASYRPDMHLSRPPCCRHLSPCDVRRKESGIVATTAARSALRR